MIRILLALMLVMISNLCIGQRPLLMLQKANRNKNTYYGVGEVISFRLKGSNEKISGRIMGLKDSVIILDGFVVRVDEISSLYIDGKTKWWLRYKVEQIGLLAGGGYLLLDFLNTGELSNETLVISGSLIAVGLIAKLFIGNRIKIKGRTRLRILNL